MNIISILEKNKYLRTDNEVRNLLNDKQFKLIKRFSKNKNLIMYEPYISLYIIKL